MIIKVTETHEQVTLGLDDIFQLGTRITVRDYIQNTLLQERQQEALIKAREALMVDLKKGTPFTINENNLRW
jgi:hypothetical protein